MAEFLAFICRAEDTSTTDQFAGRTLKSATFTLRNYREFPDPCDLVGRLVRVVFEEEEVTAIDNTSIEHGGYKHYDRGSSPVVTNLKDYAEAEQETWRDRPSLEHPEPKSEHIRFTDSRITFTSHPEGHANEPGLRGFKQIEDTGLYRGIYEGDPETELDLDSHGAPLCAPKQETWRDRPSQL